MKYIEQPAFETNEFKVGDSIMIYDPVGVCKATVYNSKNDIVSVTFDNGTGFAYYHFKQCRLLLPTKPREWLVSIDKKRNRISCDIYNTPGPLIKVREVLED